MLARPAVEAGEKLGFLPGDLQDKVDPYLRPLYDALYDLLDYEKVSRLLERNAIEVAPIAFMRGRTLNDAFVIIDEAQNTTTEQMKMVLTRIGFGSKVVITGDITQIDLPQGLTSGLVEAISVLAGRERDLVRLLRREGRGAAPPGAGGDQGLRGLRRRPGAALIHAHRTRNPAARAGGRGRQPAAAPPRRRSRGCRASCARAADALRVSGEVALVLAGDRALRALNHRYRGKDKPTDVLSVPAGRARRATRPRAPRATS